MHIQGDREGVTFNANNFTYLDPERNLVSKMKRQIKTTVKKYRIIILNTMLKSTWTSRNIKKKLYIKYFETINVNSS